jgi:hypothetical protein
VATGIEHGDDVLAALQELGGQADTVALAEQAEFDHTATLAAAGKLGKAGFIHLSESDRPSRGNPSWRLPEIGEAGFVE